MSGHYVLALLMLSGHFYNLSGCALSVIQFHICLYLYIHLHNNVKPLARRTRIEINHMVTLISDFESCDTLIATLSLVFEMDLLYAGNSQEKPVKSEQDTTVEKAVATRHYTVMSNL